jgi:hypothetical protein
MRLKSDVFQLTKQCAEVHLISVCGSRHSFVLFSASVTVVLLSNRQYLIVKMYLHFQTAFYNDILSASVVASY